jgi:transcription elongation factor GreA
VILVGEHEADTKAGKISTSSPIGKAILGKKKDEIAKVILPDGRIISYKIMEISNA